MLRALLWLICIALVAALYTSLACQFNFKFFGYPAPYSYVFDDLARSFVSGKSTVSADYIGNEAFAGREGPVTYFGPWPALLRIIPDYFFPDMFGKWSRLSILLGSFILLAAHYKLANYCANIFCSGRWTQTLTACLIFLGLGLGTPITLLLCQVPIYHEPIIWGYASSCWAIYFLLQLLKSPERAPTSYFLGFALAASVALLARVPFAIPHYLAALILGCQLIFAGIRDRQLSSKRANQLLALALPILIAGTFQLWYNYDRFGNFFEFWTKERWVQYQEWQKVVLDENGPYNLKRLPYTIYNYYGLRLTYFSDQSPYLSMPLANLPGHTSLFNAPDELTSLTVLSTWLVLLGCAGSFWILFKSPNPLLKVLLLGFAAQQSIILVYFAVTHRYLFDLLPLHLFAAAIFINVLVEWPRRRLAYLTLTAVLMLSIYFNLAATFSYLAFGRTHLPDNTREQIKTFLAHLG